MTMTRFPENHFLMFDCKRSRLPIASATSDNLQAILTIVGCLNIMNCQAPSLLISCHRPTYVTLAAAACTMCPHRVRTLPENAPSNNNAIDTISHSNDCHCPSNAHQPHDLLPLHNVYCTSSISEQVCTGIDMDKVPPYRLLCYTAEGSTSVIIQEMHCLHAKCIACNTAYSDIS